MVQQSVSNEIGVKTYEQTYSYVVNKSMETVVNYLNLRGLDMSKLTEQRDTLEQGLWTWITGRHLKELTVEVYEEDSGTLVERFDIKFEITDPDDVDDATEAQMSEQDFDFYWEQVQRELAEYNAPPSGVTYRFVVSIGRNNDGRQPPSVDGWGEVVRKDDSHLEKQNHGDLVDTGNVTGQYEFRK